LHSFYLFFSFSGYSIDTIFILGDGLIRLLLRWNLLLLRWEKSAPILFCSWIFLGRTKGGCRAGFEPGTAVQQPDALTT
jgi:hypothetical protein